tara:strand:- start:5884 stop:6339 length:456 start_codon:yes stop_codon:yes gene_type:complete
MNIAKALKEKNRTTGRITKLQTQVLTNNRYEKGVDRDYNSMDLLKSLQEEWAFLIDLKSKIATANIGIADNLIALTEAKAELTFWNGFHSGQPSEEVVVNVYDGTGVNKAVTHTYINTISSRMVDDNVLHIQKQIEDLQDEIDNYNAITKI